MYTTVSHWDHCFCEGRVSIKDDTRSECLKISTNEQNVKLVADFLEKDHARCEIILEVDRNIDNDHFLHSEK